MRDRVAEDLFEEVRELPDPTAKRAYDRLVGLDDVKTRLAKEALLLIRPATLSTWSETHHKRELPLIHHYRDRLPLFVFAGDVGTGKTALAETFGDRIARDMRVPVRLYRLSLRARGSGAVGEMTRLLGTAFDEVRNDAQRLVGKNGEPNGALILTVDEADALAQSRESAQMHHEDRAGVNALIRGVSDLGGRRLPVIVVMCTNRLAALDPAVVRRAGAIFTFTRPNQAQRIEILRALFDGIGLSEQQFDSLADALGDRRGDGYGHTYSDIVERFLSTAILDAFPDSPLAYGRLLQIASESVPTQPFSFESA